MEFSCCTSRKKPKNKLDDIKKNNSPESKWLHCRDNSLELIQNFNESVEIDCSYILCCNKGIRPLKRQATIGNNIYYFCSTECWQEWIGGYNIKNLAYSPSSLKSPEIINCPHKISNIPPLLI